MSPALEGHVAKYRKLVPALALINHLADSGDGLVGIEALLKALAFSRYLESHARRVYGARARPSWHRLGRSWPASAGAHSVTVSPRAMFSDMGGRG